MPDRYGDDDREPVDLDAPAVPAPVADFDSRRRAREAAAAVERARQQRERLAQTRSVHAPLSAAQSAEARGFQRAVTDRADARRRAARIANCGLCDDEGYRGATPCDHIDHRPAYERGMTAVREAMGWDTGGRTADALPSRRAAGRPNQPHPSHLPGGTDQAAYRPSSPSSSAGDRATRQGD